MSSGDLDITAQEASQGDRKAGEMDICLLVEAQDPGYLIPRRAEQIRDKAQHYWKTDSRGT